MDPGTLAVWAGEQTAHWMGATQVPVTHSVSFGFREPQFRIVGTPMGICRRHEHSIGKGRMHVIVDPPRRS